MPLKFIHFYFYFDKARFLTLYYFVIQNENHFHLFQHFIIHSSFSNLTIYQNIYKYIQSLYNNTQPNHHPSSSTHKRKYYIVEYDATPLPKNTHSSPTVFHLHHSPHYLTSIILLISYPPLEMPHPSISIPSFYKNTFLGLYHLSPRREMMNNMVRLC